MMIILTCANNDKAKTDQGVVLKKFSFGSLIQKTIRQANICGYETVVYDLGTLGFGEPYRVEDRSFIEKGYYEKEVIKGYKSKSLFKPDIVKLCMSNNKNKLVAYLDGDAQLCGCIDEVNSDDFDIGVTLRDVSELESAWHQDHIDIVRYVNAGVIFFRPTKVARKFVDNWKEVTQDVGNDQMALNSLTCPDNYPEVGSIKVVNGVRIKYFPGKKYNYYYFYDGFESDIKIMHFKGNVRHFYPFDWKKKLYCQTVAPIRSRVSTLKNKFLG